MSLLPIIDILTYTLKLPVSEQNIKFRPYFVKEWKLLLAAIESDDKNTLIETISQIVSNCVLSPINTTELPLTDVEFLFYNISARSQSETIDVKYRCEAITGIDNICGTIMYHKLNLLTDLDVTESLSTTIKITDKIGVKVRHQRFEIDSFKEKIPTPDELFKIIASNIEFIYDEKSSYNSTDVSIDQLIEWLGKLTVEQYAKIEGFFLNEPKIHKKINIKCKTCGTDHNIEVEDIFDFFF